MNFSDALVDFRNQLYSNSLSERLLRSMDLIREKAHTNRNPIDLSQEIFMMEKALEKNPIPTQIQSQVCSLQLNPEKMEELYRVGRLAYLEGKAEAAADLFTLLALLDEKNEVAYQSLGIAEQQSGHFQFAIQAYQLAAVLAPHNPTPHMYSAECHIMLGDFSKAKECVDSAFHLMEVGYLPEQKLRAESIKTYLNSKLPH